MKSRKAVAQTIRNRLNFAVEPPLRAQLLAHALQEQQQARKTPPAREEPLVRRMIMRNPLVRLAAAAVFVGALGLGITEFVTTGGKSGVAWAGLAQKLNQINDCVYRERHIESIGVRTPGFELKDESETWWYFSANYGSRWDQYRGKELIGQYYRSGPLQQSVFIQTSGKTYCSRPDAIPVQTCLDPVGPIRQVLEKPYVKLGRTTIDGVLVEGIEVQGQQVGAALLDNAVSRLWVNVETQLPVWLESEGQMHGTDVHCRQIRDQFKWNTNLTAADFTPVIPADFVQKDWDAEHKPQRPDIAGAAAKGGTPVDFGPLLKLGLASNDQPPTQPAITVTGMDEIRAARDAVMSAWPKYADLRDTLRQELEQKLNLPSCSPDRLVQLGILLREKFWDVGGDFSATSYRYGYMARVLVETAYAREPNSLAVGDELAETIMATETIGSRPDFRDTLRTLRTAQFQQVRAEVDKGRPPVWEDFARVSDLVYLYRNAAERMPVIDWLTEHAQAGGWTGYANTLAWMRAHADKGGLGYNIYIAAGSKYPEEFRYGGRLPSFKGPQSRAVVPAHPLTPAGTPQPSQ